MLGARLIVLPILPWTFFLITGLAIEAAEQAPMAETKPTKVVAAEAGDAAKQAPSPAPGAIETIPTEKTPAKSQAKPQPPAKTQSPTKNPEQEQTASPERPPSILQMLEGHETELAIAAAIAVGSFFIGWICGGNYYLRRDRQLRRKIRF
ncbi:MAG TPA: hypothetical protein VHV54_03150 [Candidatus Binatia bacterium]|nr:hypothetical protein [Candidatus Binatia bacterium]